MRRRSFSATFRYRRAGTRSPGRTCRICLIFPAKSVDVRRRSWGSPFAGLLPSAGGLASPPRRAHVPFFIRARPDLFSSGNFAADRCQFPRSGEIEGEMCGFWASLPSMVRVAPARLSRRADATDPAMGFASCRVVGTNGCTRTDSTPSESSASAKPLPAAIRSWVFGVSFPQK